VGENPGKRWGILVAFKLRKKTGDRARRPSHLRVRRGGVGVFPKFSAQTCNTGGEFNDGYKNGGGQEENQERARLKLSPQRKKVEEGTKLTSVMSAQRFGGLFGARGGR